MARITNEQAAYLLCSAFEGGSNYWYLISDYTKPEVEATPMGAKEYHPPYISYPFSKGGAVHIVDMEEAYGIDPEEYEAEGIEIHVLDHAAIVRGKKLMEEREDVTHHFVNVLKDNADAETGDVFLQLCLFGEVVYG